MATILAFRPGAERTQPAGHRLAALGDAEIVIFPGVRIERYDDAPALGFLRPLEDDESEVGDSN